MSVGKRGVRARKEGRGVGGGIALAALLLIVGLVLGGVAALKLGDQPFVRRVFNTAPRTTVKTVTVRTETTPASCLTAIDTLRSAVASLAGTRQQLMQGDVARASGDQATATRAYSDVDAVLRSVEVETTKDPLRAAVEDCRSKAPLTATTPPTGTAPATQTPVSPSPSQ
jgi:hypothetical protein